MKRMNVRRFLQLSIIVTSFSSLLWIEPVGASVHNLMKPVYHVYIDGENIGTVDSRAVLDKNIEELKDEKDIDGIELSVENDVEVVTERLFKPPYDNKEALEQLEEEITFIGEGYSLSFNDEQVGSFSSEKEAKDALWSYAKPFLSDEKVKEIEKTVKSMEDSDQEFHPVEAVEFSNPFEIEKVEVHPNDVVSEEKGVSLLANGYKAESEYEVEKNQSLNEIAKEFKMKKEELMNRNNLSNNDEIEKGDQLKVLQEKEFATVLETIEVEKSEEIDFEVIKKKSSKLLKGEEKVKQDGEKGKKLVTYSKEYENGQIVEEDVVKEDVTKKPISKEIVIGTKEISSKGTGTFGWPAVGGTITSKQGERWGSYHKGIDIAGVTDKTIKTVDNGKVTAAGTRSGYGKQVTVSHNNGMKTTYSHLASISVSKGDTVQKGDKIGVMGTTGKSTGIHLHFEVYKNGQLENPMDYLKK
ncbi:peptidoglycan DD-metalloendopeptidase family protein [Bacillus hwajinpoensis]|uniref:Peptidoglycan DD-metalloendopeptidase family protein n=1 Tax=Guptibacillus hwajinpoensis TaxID=208199 RepID=A0A845EVS5_9BACL|nr:peptidoglycan DD-metalloendopeptidase family protein [Pseudalkalibacillus hwajinpoensis]MYL62598.1 peptidoglycan DD-metalloendopeptidase family protein [Pseudalkalibacillus hwajinpoensis]